MKELQELRNEILTLRNYGVINKEEENSLLNKLNTINKQLRIGVVSSSAEFKVWDDLFGILAWKFKPTKSGDMYLDGEAVYNELKNKFELKRK